MSPLCDKVAAGLFLPFPNAKVDQISKVPKSGSVDRSQKELSNSPKTGHQSKIMSEMLQNDSASVDSKLLFQTA